MYNGRKESKQRQQENDSEESSYSKDSNEELNLRDIFLRDDDTLEAYPGAERLTYDFAAERRNFYPTNIWESLAHLVKTCLGVGFLGIHEGYMHGGIWTSLAVSVFIAFVATYNMLLLVSSAHIMYERLRTPKLTYPDLIQVAVKYGPLRCFRRWNKMLRYTVDVFLFVELCSVCSAYHIMISITLKQLLEAVSVKAADLNLDLRIYILIVVVPIVMICLIRSLKLLAPFSLIADVFIVLCSFASIYYSMRQANSLKDIPAWKNVQGLFRFSGIFIYSVDGITMVLPVENTMSKPRYMPLVIKAGMAIVVVITCFVGFFGYWGWGEQCHTPIVTNLPVGLGSMIVQFLLILMFTVTYAVHFWVPFRVAWRYLGKTVKRKRGRWERIYRIVLVLVLCFLSIPLHNINKVISFIGNFFSAFLTFVFPALIDSLVTWHRTNPHRHFRLLKNFLIMAFGVVLTIGALYSYREWT